MVSTAGVNCKLNARVYVQMLHSPRTRHLLVAWGPLPADTVVWPRLVHPWRGGAEAGTGRRHSPMSFSPPWVFLIIKISGLRTSDFFWFPIWETQSQATPESSRPRGLLQGMMGLGKEWWPEERMVL